jgi:TonB-linked SusC/RagA family outer membrane protein
MNENSTLKHGRFVTHDKEKPRWLLKRCALVLLFLLTGMLAFSQTTPITGKVLDEKGQPIPGASIRVKGTNIATVSSATGDFSITAAPNATITVTYVGYTAKETAVNNQKNVSISLSPSSSELSEVVVVGYGTQKKVNLTGSVASVSSEQIVTTKNENVQNMLTGKIAGVTVVQNSSEPGSFDNTFDLRGMGSPLVIIDGIPRENISRLDPNDIESISVLKDASAAVYGVRAANGVVLVTTKRGKKGSTALNYSGTQTFQVPVGLPKSVDAIGYMTLVNERLLHNVNGGTPAYTDADFEAYRNGSRVSTDWYSPVIKDVIPQSQHNLSASGGSENTNYFLSLGYTGQQGFLKSNDLNYKRYNVRSNITSRVTRNLTVDLNINAIMDEKNQPYTDAWYIIRSFWRQNPLETIYANNNPQYLFHPGVDGTNPVSLADKDVVGYKKFTQRWLQSSISLTYDVPFIKGLKAKGLYSYDYNTSDNKLYQKQYNQYTYDAATDAYKAIAQQSPSTLRREYFSKPKTLSQLSLNYDRTIGQSHNFSALLLLENSNRQGDNFYAQRELSLPVDQLLAGNSLNQIGSMNAGDLYEDANSGLVGRLNYNYKGKYLVEFSFRDDISSKFPVYNQEGFFPSVSAGWRISEEGFWKNATSLSFINNLKLRASYGKLGDDGASRYQFVNGYTYPAGGDNNRLPPGSVFGGAFVNALASKGLVNPDIFWYVAKTLDIGVDVEAWNGLLGATIDVFRRDRSGLIATRNLSLPSVVGATLPEENLNSDRSQGFDLELNHRHHIGDFNYFVKAIFSYQRTQNRYVEKARAGNSYENWRNNSNNRYNDARWGYGAAGQFQSYNDLINSPTFVGRNTVVGDYAYEDWNGDGIISDLDLHPIAFNGIPKINYGLTIGGSYKGIDVNMLFQGTGIVNVSYPEQLREPLWGGGSGLEQFLDRWHTQDPGADPYDPNTKWVPGHFANTGSLPEENSDYNLQDASYLRLKSVELGYSLSPKLTSKIGIKGARIYVNGYNIFTITDVKYVDPEHPSSTFGYVYPLNKTYSVGLNVTF